MDENKESVASIQLLRALAAIFVVALHEQFYYRDYANLVHSQLPAMSAWHHLLTFGGMGVDLFFVISGFIMAYLVGKNPEQGVGGFFWRRITRIVPLYWLINVFWLWWDPRQPIRFVVSSFIFIPVKGVFPLNGVGWTLNMEMFFYLVFGLIVVCLKKSILWIALFFLLLSVAGQVSDNYVIDFYGNPLIWCFFAGLVIHRYYRHPLALRWAPAFLTLGAGGLFYACLDFGASSAWAPDTVLYWGVPCACLTFGCVSLEAGREWNGLWQIRLLQALGAASYSIYLVHPIGFANLDYYLLTYTGAVHLIGPDGAVLLLIAAAALAGYVVHRLIELPSINLVRARRLWPRAP